MNRIILIGNGFDRAHGLRTGYEDFISWYWEQWIKKLRDCHANTISDGLCTFTLKQVRNTWYNLLYRQGFSKDFPKGKEFVKQILNDKDSYEIGFSPLFKQIQTSMQEKNWVDIENEYYRLLTESISDKGKPSYSSKELNNQLAIIIHLLIQYLTSLYIHDGICNDNIIQIILEPIKIDDIATRHMGTLSEFCNDLANTDRHTLVNRFKVKNDTFGENGEMINLIDYFLKNVVEKDSEGRFSVRDITKVPSQLLTPNKTMLLSFNYTHVSDAYALKCNLRVNHIHGDLANPQNMIFGYGDELDDNHQLLLNQEDNEYLKNIKSIRYLESSNYREMLKFIGSAPYQIYIMGHSCGNSDRTLLNTLFEHENCVSIKPFYHQKKSGEDNYIEIIQNICRNFTDMKLMRDRVVNKTFCEPLPQV